MALNATIVGGPRDGEHMPMESFPAELRIIEQSGPCRYWTDDLTLPDLGASLGCIGRYAQHRGFDGEVFYVRVGRC